MEIVLLKVYNTDALTALAQMEDESVQCCVTSPPYWGLRDYGIPPLIWDGDPDCVHVWTTTRQYKDSPTRSGSEGVGFDDPETTKAQRWREHDLCSRCGAWRGSLGLEPTPDVYVRHLVQIFREARRVLRDDGVLWLNLGDCYATGAGKVGDHPGGGEQGAKWAGRHPGREQQRLGGAGAGVGPMTQPNRLPISGLKPKDLVGIPWMAAFALRADGWWLRMDVIWNKPAPMPESVTDRPTKSHEYIFLLTKSQKYYYDHEAIKEPAVAAHGSGNGYKRSARLTYGGRGSDEPFVVAKESVRRNGSKRVHGNIPGRDDGGAACNKPGQLMRNKRSVWTVNTKPFNDAHFATFPSELIVPCILAGCPRGGVVLDVCAGSGTVGKVAIELGRKAILIEPNANYCKMIDYRTTTTIGLPL